MGGGRKRGGGWGKGGCTSTQGAGGRSPVPIPDTLQGIIAIGGV